MGAANRKRSDPRNMWLKSPAPVTNTMMDGHKLRTLDQERAMAALVDTVEGRPIDTSMERILRDREALEHTLFEMMNARLGELRDGSIDDVELEGAQAALRWVSAEPLLGSLNASLAGMDWVVAGGESGAGARPMHPAWIRIRSPQSNGMSEAFVKTLKRDYARVTILPDANTILAPLPHWIEDYCEVHPHSGLKFRSPREFIRLSA